MLERKVLHQLQVILAIDHPASEIKQHQVHPHLPVDWLVSFLSTVKSQRQGLSIQAIGGIRSLGANPLLGVFLHWLGGLASASFYVPYRQVRGWSWETYWLAGGIVSWIVMPWLLAGLITHDLLSVLHSAPSTAIFWSYFFGVLWGLGGLTFGLTMRYLGLSLGMAVALGYTAAFGTLMPPIFRGVFSTEVLGTISGRVILVGVGACLAGIVFAGLAGMSKERELSEEQKRASIKEFALKKGLLIATF